MAEESRKYYDEEYLKSKVTTAIETTTPEMPVHKGYLELGMRNLGLLVDKTINENHNFNETDLDKMREQAIEGAIEAVSGADSLIQKREIVKENANVSPAEDNAKS
jgi:hypothetical protein